VISFDQITFVITTFKSEKVIFDCLSELPSVSPKIIIENSGNNILKTNLENKFQNLECFIMNENIGYGKANNFGISKSKTNYIFIINPDTLFSKKNLNLFLSKLEKENFSIASVLEDHDKRENTFNGNDVKEVNHVKGFAMLLNKENMFGKYFDENFFLYLEEIDLCWNVKKSGGRIILVNIRIKHKGGRSHGNKEDLEIEKSRNWHWMWSKFYFFKKHYGFLIAFIKTFPIFLSSFFKYVFYFFTLNKKKRIFTK
jgi:N-acetylglucosaminyl-diphospho-decaprenol L-rhamnosyltransferase